MRLYSTLDHFITSVFLVYKCYISVHCNSLFVKEVKQTFLGTLTQIKSWSKFIHVKVFFLMCTVSVLTCFSEIIYSWVFNEFPSFVAEDSRRFISQDTGNLYISKVQPSDVGSYICLVKNTVTNARVLSPPTPLTLKTDGECFFGYITQKILKFNVCLTVTES